MTWYLCQFRCEGFFRHSDGRGNILAKVGDVVPGIDGFMDCDGFGRG